MKARDSQDISPNLSSPTITTSSPRLSKSDLQHTSSVIALDLKRNNAGFLMDSFIIAMLLFFIFSLSRELEIGIKHERGWHIEKQNIPLR